MSWYLAPSLVALTDQTDARMAPPDWPTVGIGDGSVGDTSHSARESDHNPDYDSGGVVRAVDIGIQGRNAKAILNAAIGDRRVWYVIHRRKIYSRTYGWAARRYTGSNPHNHHIHISIRHTDAAERDTGPWFSGSSGGGGGSGGGAQWEKKSNAKPGKRTISRWSVGSDVAFVQRFLGITEDGYYGPKTLREVKRYQRMRGLKADGVVGDQTWRHLLGKAAPQRPARPERRRTVDYSNVRAQAQTGGDKQLPGVRHVQRALNQVLGGENIKVDGYFGPATITQYGRWQWSLGYRGGDADGVPGWTSIRKLARRSKYFRVHK